MESSLWLLSQMDSVFFGLILFLWFMFSHTTISVKYSSAIAGTAKDGAPSQLYKLSDCDVCQICCGSYADASDEQRAYERGGPIVSGPLQRTI